MGVGAFDLVLGWARSASRGSSFGAPLARARLAASTARVASTSASRARLSWCCSASDREAKSSTHASASDRVAGKDVARRRVSELADQQGRGCGPTHARGASRRRARRAAAEDGAAARRLIDGARGGRRRGRVAAEEPHRSDRAVRRSSGRDASRGAKAGSEQCESDADGLRSAETLVETQRV